MTLNKLNLPIKFCETLLMETTVGMSTDFLESPVPPIIRMEALNFVLSKLQGHIYTPLMTVLQLVNSRLQQSERFLLDSSLELEPNPEASSTLQWYDNWWGLASAYLESSLSSPITKLETSTGKKAMIIWSELLVQRPTPEWLPPSVNLPNSLIRFLQSSLMDITLCAGGILDELVHSFLTQSYYWKEQSQLTPLLGIQTRFYVTCESVRSPLLKAINLPIPFHSRESGLELHLREVLSLPDLT